MGFLQNHTSGMQSQRYRLLQLPADCSHHGASGKKKRVELQCAVKRARRKKDLNLIGEQISSTKPIRSLIVSDSNRNR